MECVGKKFNKYKCIEGCENIYKCVDKSDVFSLSHSPARGMGSCFCVVSSSLLLLLLLSHSPRRGMGSCFCVVSSSLLLLYAQ